MLYFNSDKFDFWEIYERIKYCYPIGIKKDESSIYYSYPGLKELEDIIVENIHDAENCKSRWEDFVTELEKELGKEIIGTTYGQAPSFSSYVLLETATLENLTRTKELHFFVSLVGPFYSIIGQDNNTVTIEGKHYRSSNYLIISPENEFTEIFDDLCNKIEKRFQGFRFVPFEICRKTIEGLDVRYVDKPHNSIFNALFNNHIDLNARTIGDSYFKHTDWIKEGYIDTGVGWTAYPSE